MVADGVIATPARADQESSPERNGRHQDRAATWMRVASSGVVGRHDDHRQRRRRARYPAPVHPDALEGPDRSHPAPQHLAAGCHPRWRWPGPTSSSPPRTCTRCCGRRARRSAWPPCTGRCRTWPAAETWTPCGATPARSCTGSAASPAPPPPGLPTVRPHAGGGGAQRRARGPSRSRPSTATPTSTTNSSCSALCADCTAARLFNRRLTLTADQGTSALLVQHRQAQRADPPPPAIPGSWPFQPARNRDRQVGFAVVAGQVDVGDQVDLPRPDELQPQGGDPIHVRQIPRSPSATDRAARYDLLTDQELPVPIDEHHRDDPQQHADQDLSRSHPVSPEPVIWCRPRPVAAMIQPGQRGGVLGEHRPQINAEEDGAPARGRSGPDAALEPLSRPASRGLQEQNASSRNSITQTHQMYPMTKSLAGSRSTSSWMPWVIDTATGDEQPQRREQRPDVGLPPKPSRMPTFGGSLIACSQSSRKISLPVEQDVQPGRPSAERVAQPRLLGPPRPGSWRRRRSGRSACSPADDGADSLEPRVTISSVASCVMGRS